MKYRMKGDLFILKMSGSKENDNDLACWKLALEAFRNNSIAGLINNVILDFSQMRYLDNNTISHLIKMLQASNIELPVKRVKIIVPNDRDQGLPAWINLRKNLRCTTKNMVEVPESYLEQV